MENRRRNFTPTDKQVLMALISKYYSIIENKCTKAFATKEKDNAWEKITQEFNSSSESGLRTVKQLRVLYDNMKRATRKSAVDEHQEPYLMKLKAIRATAADIKRVVKIEDDSSSSVSAEQEVLLANIPEQEDPLSSSDVSAAKYFEIGQMPGPLLDIPDAVSDKSEDEESEHQQSVQNTADNKKTTKKEIMKRKRKMTAEKYKILYFKQKYLNAVNEGKAQKILNNLMIEKLQLEIQKLKQ